MGAPLMSQSKHLEVQPEAIRGNQRQSDGRTLNVPIEAFGGAPVAAEDAQALERRVERA